MPLLLLRLHNLLLCHRRRRPLLLPRGERGLPLDLHTGGRVGHLRERHVARRVRLTDHPTRGAARAVRQHPRRTRLRDCHAQVVVSEPLRLKSLLHEDGVPESCSTPLHLPAAHLDAFAHPEPP